MGWGGAPRAEPRGLLCVITEDIPVEQEELISEAFHLVTLFLHYQPPQGRCDEVERTGALEGGRSELESWSFPPGLWGWLGSSSLGLSPHQ